MTSEAQQNEAQLSYTEGQMIATLLLAQGGQFGFIVATPAEHTTRIENRLTGKQYDLMISEAVW